MRFWKRRPVPAEAHMTVSMGRDSEDAPFKGWVLFEGSSDEIRAAIKGYARSYDETVAFKDLSPDDSFNEVTVNLIDEVKVDHPLGYWPHLERGVNPPPDQR